MAEPQRPDGLVDVRCPYCRQCWYRMQPTQGGTLYEINCPGGRCRRIVLYRVDHGQVEDLAATRL
jgi:hypothetical protein